MDVRQTLGGRYKLLNELGNGGMAVVWRARDEVLGRAVAVKVLAGRYSGDPQSRARIRDEARAAANLSHPNIAQVYDYGEADDRPYVVMELINGPTLQQRVAEAPLPPRTVFRICGEVAAALAAAHAEGLVHRDIKMANIMVTAGGAKVVDFGIAAVAGPAAPEEMLVGTPAYLAPERLTGDVVQPASDVYALGVLLYRLLADESPWSVESTTQMLKAHVYIEPAPLPPLPGVPSAVVTLIGECLRKDPQTRPTASRVSTILADAAEALPEVRDKAAAAGRRGAAPAGRSGAGLAGGSAAAGVAAAGGVAAGSADLAGGGAAAGGARLAAGGAGVGGGDGRNGGSAADDAGRGGSSAAGGGRGRDAVAPKQTDRASAEVADDLHADTGIFVTDRARGSNDRIRPADQRGTADARRSGNQREAGDRRAPGAVVAAMASGAAQQRAETRVEHPAATKVGGALTRPAHPGAAEPVESQGRRRADGVPGNRRKSLLAVGGVAAVIAAVLAAWVLIGDDEPDRRGAAAGTTASEAPARNSTGGGAPPVTSTVGADDPAAPGLPGPGVIIGSGPAPSAGPSSPGATSGSASQAPPGVSSSATASESPSAVSEGKRLTSPGGSVRATCARGKATLNSYEPADGYTVEKVEPGPALAPQIVFKGAKSRYRMTVTCVAGVPTPVVLPL